MYFMLFWPIFEMLGLRNFRGLFLYIRLFWTKTVNVLSIQKIALLTIFSLILDQMISVWGFAPPPWPYYLQVAASS